MKNEIWKTINNYDNYEISNTGKVRNKKTGKFLIPINSGKGYFQVALSKNNVTKKFLLHRLVADAFIQNPEGLETVDHLDGNK